MLKLLKICILHYINYLKLSKWNSNVSFNHSRNKKILKRIPILCNDYHWLSNDNNFNKKSLKKVIQINITYNY